MGDTRNVHTTTECWFRLFCRCHRTCRWTNRTPGDAPERALTTDETVVSAVPMPAVGDTDEVSDGYGQNHMLEAPFLKFQM